MIDSFSSWLLFAQLGFDPKTKIGESLHFFIYDSIKILLLLLLLTFLVGIINSYFPVEKVKQFLTKRNWYGLDHLLASLFGAITPFCSFKESHENKISAYLFWKRLSCYNFSRIFL